MLYVIVMQIKFTVVVVGDAHLTGVKFLFSFFSLFYPFPHGSNYFFVMENPHFPICVVGHCKTQWNGN